tara:strand:- start:147 stop:353 length:207 start_codon:yes stop_codon:yes gene_type:complete
LVKRSPILDENQRITEKVMVIDDIVLYDVVEEGEDEGEGEEEEEEDLLSSTTILLSNSSFLVRIVEAI